MRSHNEEDQIDNSYAKKKYFSELFFTGTLLVVIGVPRKQGVRVPKSAERAQRVFGKFLDCSLIGRDILKWIVRTPGAKKKGVQIHPPGQREMSTLCGGLLKFKNGDAKTFVRYAYPYLYLLLASCQKRTPTPTTETKTYKQKQKQNKNKNKKQK